MGDLVEREAPRTGVDELCARPERDLEARADRDAATVELRDGLLDVGDVVDEHGLIARRCSASSTAGGSGLSVTIATRVSKALDREHLLRTQRGEVRDVGGDVAAGEVDEVELVEHDR